MKTNRRRTRRLVDTTLTGWFGALAVWSVVAATCPPARADTRLRLSAGVATLASSDSWGALRDSSHPGLALATDWEHTSRGRLRLSWGLTYRVGRLDLDSGVPSSAPFRQGDTLVRVQGTSWLHHLEARADLRLRQKDESVATSPYLGFGWGFARLRTQALARQGEELAASRWHRGQVLDVAFGLDTRLRGGPPVFSEIHLTYLFADGQEALLPTLQIGQRF